MCNDSTGNQFENIIAISVNIMVHFRVPLILQKKKKKFVLSCNESE